MLSKILLITVFVATNILSYNMGYLQAIGDFYWEIREQIHYDRYDRRTNPGPAVKTLENI